MRRSRASEEAETGAICPFTEGLPSLFARNRTSASARTLHDRGFFGRLVGQQRPHYFWIGSSDSRVPATEILDLHSGEMFVHRNVASLAITNDPNFAAALQFAVGVLKVEHFIIVGHYGCGGIPAAMSQESHDAIGSWLAPVRELYRCHSRMATPGSAEADGLCERNVVAQVEALAVHPLLRRAWERVAKLALHGWVYAIGDGLVQEVCKPVLNAMSCGHVVSSKVGMV